MSKHHTHHAPRQAWLTLSLVIAILLNFLPGLAPGVAIPSASAHNLNASVTYVFFDPDTQAMLDARINGWTPPQPLLQVGDELGLVIKAVPDLGTTTGVGGYTTFYIPNGLQVVDAAFLLPGSNPADGITGWDKVPAKGQALMPAVGAGGESTVSLVGVTRGPNILGVTSTIVTATNANLGTLPGVYGDTGIFFSTAPETAYGTYTGGALTNNSGDTVGLRTALGTPLNAWDAWQEAAYGIAGTTNPAYPSAALVDSNQRGYAPWGLANVVAGPQSGYAWGFNKPVYDACDPTPTTSPQANCIDLATQQMGPWQRIKYPGSQFSDDPPGARPAVQPYTRGANASDSGWALSPSTPLTQTVSQTDATSPKALRFAFGQLTYNIPEYAWVKVKVYDTAAILDATGCPKWTVDTFGGDAGGDSGGKDHIWRYYDPNSVSFNGCVAIGKPATREVVKAGDTYQYKIKLYNMGNGPLTNVVISDTLPSGVTFISAAPAQNSGPNPLRWNVGTFLQGQKFEATVTVKATGSGLLGNTVTVTGLKDGGPVSGMGAEETPSGSIPLLSQNKSVSPVNVAPGGTVTYTVTIDNIGSGPTGSPVTIKEYLPAGFTYLAKVSATVNGADVTAATTVNTATPYSTNTPFFTLPAALDAGGALVLKFTAQVSASEAPGAYCNSYTSNQNGINLTTGALACVNVGGGQIGDTIFRDWLGDGVQDAGDEPLSGVTVDLYAGACGPSGGVLQTQTTGANGSYLFTGLTSGAYCVDVASGVPAGYTLTAGSDPLTVNLAENQAYLTADFGYRPGGTGSIGDQVFEDISKDGTFNGSDAGIASVTVWLYEDTNGDGLIGVGDTKIMTTTTDAGGIYTFTSLATGLNYLVDVDQSDADIQTYFDNKYGASSFQITTADPHRVTALAGAYTAADFGFWRVLPGSIGDTVFADVNGDGVYSPTVDSPLANVTVQLLNDLNGNGDPDPGEPIITASSTVTGFYTFGNLGPGNYVVTVDTADPSIPAGYVSTVAEYYVTLAAGENMLTADFPFVQLIAKTVSPAAVATVPATLTYTITINYPTDQLLSGVVVTDAIPISTTYVADSINASGYYTDTPDAGGPPQVVWDLGSNEPGLPGLTASAGNALCPVVYTTVITKDTWIDQANAANNNGGNALLLTKPKAGSLKYILLGPDVSGIPSGAVIRSARLYLNVQTNKSNHFDKAYTLKTAWTEGTGTNDACGTSGNGATWNAPNCTDTWAGGAFSVSDYYTNTLGTLSPSTKGYKSVDVSTAVNAWVGGTANRGLVLVSTGTDGGDAKYYNEENTTANTDPYLRVVYLVQTPGGCGGTTTLESSADTYVDKQNPTTNDGAATTMNTRPDTNTRHSLVQWDLATIASGAVISSTVVTFTVTTQRFDTPQDHWDQVRKMTTPWSETGATWNTRDGTTTWAGGSAFSSADYGTTSHFTITQPGSNNTAVTGTLTSLVNDWVNNGIANNGIVLLATGADNGDARYGTRDNGTAGYRPKLTVNWWLAPNAGATTVTHLRASPMLLGSTGQVRVTMEITASATITNVTPPADLAIGSGAGGASGASVGGTKISGPTPSTPVTVTAGGMATFVWVYEVTPDTNPSAILFTGRPTAPGTTTSFAPATSNSVLIVPALSFQVRADVMPPTGFVSNTARLTEGSVPTEVESPPAITAFGASIGDRVWADLDGNGLQDVGEPGVPGVQVCASPQGGGMGGGCAATDASGNYRIYGLTNGTPYTVTMNLATTPTGYQLTTDTSLVRTATTAGVDDADFGLQPPGTATIGDTVWLDANNNGSLDGTESGLPGITVKLYASDGTTLLATTTTDASGVYTFTGLNVASYQVRVDTASLVTTTYGVTSTLGAAMTPTVGTVNPKTVTITTPGQVVTDADFGYSWSGSIGDYVWYDDDLNGLPNESSTRAIAGAFVLLYYDTDGNGVLDPAEYTPLNFMDTDAGGIYTFANLPPGNYLVDVYEDSFTVGGAREAIPTTPNVRVVTLAAGQPYDLADFGYYDGALIEGHVFWDADRTQTLDAGETRLANVTVTLKDSAGNTVATTTSDATGYFKFLTPAETYTVTYTSGAPIPADLTDATTPTSYAVTAQGGPDWHVDLLFGVDNTGTIGDMIFNDADGVGGQGPGEPGLAGVTVQLYDSGGVTLLATTVTTATGGYLFTGLADATYVVKVLTSTVPLPAGFTQTYDPDGTQDSTGAATVSGNSDLSMDFGYQVSTPTFSVSGTVWNDLNGDTVRSGEPGLAGVQVSVTYTPTAGSPVVVLTTVDANGQYTVTGIPAGSHVAISPVSSTLPNAAYLPTTATTRTIPSIGGNQINQDFGYIERLSSLSGAVVVGTGNGIADSGEPPIGGVTITLRYAGADGFLGTADDVFSTTLTNASGQYTFTDLLPGLYQTLETNRPVDLSVADRDFGNPDNITINLAVSETVTTRDFEDATIYVSLGDRAWMDTNSDGSQQITETFGVPNLPLHVTGLDLLGVSVDVTVTTTYTGFYAATGLLPGTYTVTAPEVFGNFQSVTPRQLTVTLTTSFTETLDLDFGYASSTAVSLSEFTAVARPGEVRLTWKAALAGRLAPEYHVWRAAGGQAWKRLTVAPAKASAGDAETAVYVFSDTAIERGVTYLYRLESLTGESFGPWSVRVPAADDVRRFLPLVGR